MDSDRYDEMKHNKIFKLLDNSEVNDLSGGQ